MPRPCTVVASLLCSFLLAVASLPATAAEPIGVRHDEARAPAGTLAYAFRTDRLGADSGAPVYADGTLYLLTPFPHTLYALDPATVAGSRVKWRYTPRADLAAEGGSCCSRVDHGPVLEGGQLYFSTLDGRVVSIEARGGRVLWDVSVASGAQGEVLTSAPTVTRKLVLIGSGRSDHGNRGWLAALDRTSGKLLWKRYSTGSDADVGVGASFVARNAEKRADLGVSTWPPGASDAGGGGVDGAVLYDAEANLVWHGTGPPTPWNPEQRPGTNQWTSGLFARDAETGMARWFDAVAPGNPFSWRDAGADVLVDRSWQGRLRHLLVHPDGNGFLYVIDRLTGELLAADRYTASAVTSVDLATGLPHYRPDKVPAPGRQAREICPAWSGATAGPGVHDAERGVLILPVSRLCMDLEVRIANRIKGTPFVGASVRLLLPARSGGLLAWDIEARKPLWIIDESYPVVGGATLADGGRVVYGTLDGWLKTIDARDGKLLAIYRAPGGIVGRPAVWQGADGRSFAAVVSGARRLYGMTAKDGIDPRDVTAGMGYAALVHRLPPEADPAGTLIVVQLP
jgi:PQQ-dependent dehydrogenase (methanol/ethanol family)